ncbi:MAG TPA: hypothetical protein PL060_06855 [bacterium]|nr:hypothetical protein [bacterium]
MKHFSKNGFGRSWQFVRVSITDTGIGMDESSKEYSNPFSLH